jgi:hypothetical protein
MRNVLSTPVAQAPASAPVAQMPARTPQSDTAKAVPAPPVGNAGTGGGLRPIHVGAGFGALAFLLIVASAIVARRRSGAHAG